MIPSNILTSSGLSALADFITPDTLFAFDLDGTLAPIVDEHTAAKVVEPVRAVMKRLIGMARVAVITGRSRKDAQQILGVEPQLLIGNHAAPNGRTDRFSAICASCFAVQTGGKNYRMRWEISGGWRSSSKANPFHSATAGPRIGNTSLPGFRAPSESLTPAPKRSAENAWSTCCRKKR